MTGFMNNNEHNFKQAQNLLNDAGFVAINPHDIGVQQIEIFKQSDSKHQSKKEPSYWDYMKADVIKLLDCKGVSLLKGWENSTGANIELFIAQKFGIPIFYIDTFEFFDLTFQITKFPKNMI